MVIVAFKPGEKEISKYEELDQYDYGQILRIQGLNLPQAVEIHFALQKTGGTSKTRIGITEDGVTDVPIPDSMLENEDETKDYDIYAFVYITDETSGQTEYRIALKVKARPKPEVLGGQDEPTLAEIMKAVNQIADGKADGLEYENNILKLLSGDRELARVIIQGGGGGTDAREIELRKSETAIQWHYVGEETWKDLVQLSEITGKPGKDGTTPHVGDNGNWYIGDTDTGKPSRGEKGKQGENATDEQVQQAVGTYMQGVDFDAKFAEKLDKNQGAENAGKALMVGEDGNVIPGEVQGGTVDLDPTLTQSGKAADAKATGDKILQFAIKNTMQGESPLVVPDSAEEPVLGIKLFGKTEQVQTTGKKLINDELLKTLANYTTNGKDYYYYYRFSGLEVGKKYTISRGNVVSGSGVLFGISINQESYNSAKFLVYDGLGSAYNNAPITWTQTTGDYMDVLFSINAIVSQTTQEKLTEFWKRLSYVQLEEGATASQNEPYTGGKPSPSPDYPQEIVNAGKRNEDTQKYEVRVKVTCKNFLTDNYEQYTDGKYKQKVALPAGNYIYTCEKNNNIWLLHEDGSNITNGWMATNKFDFSLAKKETIELRIETKNLAGNNHMIRLQGSDDVYVPYREPQSLTFTSDRPITKWDKLVEQDGRVGWLYTRKIDVIPKTGWLYNSNGYFYKSGAFPDANKSLSPTNEINMFTHFALGNPQSNKGKDCAWLYVPEVGKDVLRVGVSDETIVTVEAFEKYISDKDMKILYEIATPEFDPLPQDQQDAIRTLATYYPTTVITTDGGELNPDVELDYVADTRNFVLGQIANINKALVNTQAQLL